MHAPRIAHNGVELAERIALQSGAPADDLDYWNGVAAPECPWPTPSRRELDDVEDWRDR